MLLVHADTEASKTNLSCRLRRVQGSRYQIWPEHGWCFGGLLFVCFFCWTEILSLVQNEMIQTLFINLLFTHTLTHMYTQPLLMSWLCLLVVHSMIEMGVWVLSGCKSACQLAFSVLFPISIKHPHHLLWAHSTAPCFPPVSCCTDRWPVINTNHFSSHIEVCLLLMLISILADWMVEWEFEHWYWDETI